MQPLETIRTFTKEALQRTEPEGQSGSSLIGVPPIDGLASQSNRVESALRELAARPLPSPPPPLASETTAGLVEQATEAEVEAGTAGNLVATVARLKAELDRRLTPPAWTAPTLLNGWSNLGGAAEVAGYRKTSQGEVQLRGTIAGGATANGTVLFNLPNVYRPDNDRHFPAVHHGNVACRVIVALGGDVTIQGAAGATFLSLEGIRFDA